MRQSVVQSKRIKALHKQFMLKVKGKNVVVEEIKMNKIKLGENSRKNVTDEEISGLMASIKESGLLQPIGVVKSGDGYEVCYGNRRFLACSKLGHTTIPAIVNTGTKNEVIFKNLAENIQRRNISLPEAGRYFTYLQNDGLKVPEIAVRLGVPVNFVKSCLSAYADVPKEFQADIVQQGQTRTVPAGKIALTVATRIINAAKNNHLVAEDRNLLFKAAKSDDKFRPENIEKYAKNLRAGKKDFLKQVKPIKKVAVRFFIDADEHEALMKRYVNDGPFQSLSGLVVAILRGEKNQKINVLKGL